MKEALLADPPAFTALLRAERVTLAYLPPAILALLDPDPQLDAPPPHERPQAPGSASPLLLALYGGVPYDVREVAGAPRLLQALRTG